jgi:hypothetical protein
MATETASQPVAAIDDPEMAFEAMSRKLAGLTAAVEGFAARQQELHARDYGPDLAAILERHDKVWSAIVTLNKRPAMQHTPELIAAQINAAGEQGRASDHQAWSNAQQHLTRSVASLDGVVQSALTAEKQRLWIAGAAAVALVIGFALGAVVPTRISQAAPERWHWPEARAAKMLGRDGWSAGMRLLAVSDQRRLRALLHADRLAEDNRERLSACRARADKAGKSLDCVIKVGKPDPIEIDTGCRLRAPIAVIPAIEAPSQKRPVCFGGPKR